MHSPQHSRLCALLLTMVTALVPCAGPVLAQTASSPAEQVRAALRAHRFDDAVAQVEAWTKAAANDTHAWFWAGRVYGQQAQHAGVFSMASWAGKARKAFERAVELDGSNVEARFDLLQFYAMAPGMLGGGVDKAREQAQAIAKLDAARGHVGLGIVAEAGDDRAGAEREYRAALERAPDDSRMRLNLGLLLAADKRYADARAVYREFLERHPDDALALYQSGRVAALSGEELDAGLVSLDKFLALAEKPDDISVGGAHWRKGQILDKLGRKDEARAEIRAGLQLDPQLDGANKDLKRLGG